MSETLEQIQRDTREAMKAGRKEQVSTLRMLASALQQDAKLGEGDPVAVLRRERKKRLEAASAFADGGREQDAAAERSEAELIESYLPAELSDEELAALVEDAIASTGAGGPGEVGRVMGAVMPKIGGRADGNRVSALVRERLGS